MKTNHSKSVYCILTAAVIVPLSSAQAIEGPPDNARPPFELLDKEDNLTPEIAQNLPFLGVVTEAVPALLATHLGLDAGSGVVILTVSPDSPAKKAGLATHDIILSIADEPVGSSDDVTAKVRKHKVGDRIALELIHKGKPSRVEVTLTERPADDNLALREHQPLLDGMLEEQAEHMRQLLDRNLKGLDQLFLEQGMLPDDRMNGAFQMLRDRMNKNLIEPPDLQMREGGFNQSTMRLNDGQGSVEIKTVDGITEVTVRDTDDNVTWTGNWTTEEDKAAAPPEIRERIEGIQENRNGFSFRFGIR